MGDDKVLNLINLIKDYSRRLDNYKKEIRRDILSNEAKASGMSEENIPQYIYDNIGRFDIMEGVADVSGGVRKLVTQMPREVAEQILAKVDTVAKKNSLSQEEFKQYLDAVDLVYGPRLERASKKGWDINKKWFHGSPKPLEGNTVKLSKSGENTGVNTANSFALTDNPEVAQGYADFGIDSGNTVTPFFIKPNNIEVRDLPNPKMIKNSIRSAQVEDAALRGKDGLMYKNLIDDPDEAIQRPSDITFLTNPKSIRSVNAVFDPRFADSDDIMAGAVAVPLTIGATNEESESYQNLRNFLKGNK